MDSSDEEFFLLDSVLPKLMMLSKRRTSVQDINKERRHVGEYHHLFSQLKNDPDKFHSYLQMNLNTFNYILDKVTPRLTKTWCNWHVPILPEERLVVTLRFLITGSSFKTLAFCFRMGATTVASIVSETVDAIWQELHSQHMSVPTKEIWNSIAVDFFNIWNFPQCLGSVDAKQIRVRSPDSSGSMPSNYKNKYFSIVLQAVVDANYKFITIDVGGYGIQNDVRTIQASDFYRTLIDGKLHLPKPTNLPHSEVKAPFVFVGDEAYPLMPFLLKPYTGTCLPHEQDNYNKRLSRCRKTVECAFGILASKWQLLTKSIETGVEVAGAIVKCVCLLHNIIIDKEGMEPNFTEISFPISGVIWNRVGRPSNNARTVRDIFATYFANNP